MITCKFEEGKETSLRHVVVDGIVIKDGKVLLIKRADHLIQGGKHALPGGFLDRDETAEEGVKREVREETGYETASLTLFNIITHPDRGEDRQNVAFIFKIEAGDKKGESDKEVQSMDWYDLDKLPSKANIAFDHYEVLQLYRQYKTKQFDLPVVS